MSITKPALAMLTYRQKKITAEEQNKQDNLLFGSLKELTISFKHVRGTQFCLNTLIGLLRLMVTTFLRLTTRKRGRRQRIHLVYTGITNLEKQFQRSSRFVTLNFPRMPNAKRKVEEVAEEEEGCGIDSRRGEHEKNVSFARNTE